MALGDPSAEGTQVRQCRSGECEQEVCVGLYMGSSQYVDVGAGVSRLWVCTRRAVSV